MSSWLQQVQSEQDRLPVWLKNVLYHPRFGSLHRFPPGDKHAGNFWRIETRDDDGRAFATDSLGGVCQQFITHYRLAGEPPQAQHTEDAVKEQIRQLENAIVEQGSIIEWVQDAAEGSPVSELGASFGVVRLIMDMRARIDELEARE